MLPTRVTAEGDQFAGLAWEHLQAALAGRPLPPVLVCIGLGEGHLLDALERHAPDTHVLALEPNRETARRFLQRRNWDDWRMSGRLSYLVEPEYAGAHDAWRIFPPGSDAPFILVHPGITANEHTARARATLKQILFGVKS